MQKALSDTYTDECSHVMYAGSFGIIKSDFIPKMIAYNAMKRVDGLVISK